MKFPCEFPAGRNPFFIGFRNTYQALYPVWFILVIASYFVVHDIKYNTFKVLDSIRIVLVKSRNFMIFSIFDINE